MTTLIINSSFLLQSKVLNNPALTQIFNRLNKIRIITDGFNISVECALKFVERFSSLTIVEMEAYSIDLSIPIVDIFLDGLAKLCLIIIQSQHNFLLDDPLSRQYIIDKRRQSFGLSKDNENKVVVKIEEQILYIRVA